MSHPVGSNRTIVGLKRLLLLSRSTARTSSNRTIVGLKQALIQKEGDTKMGSNRTIVGLKLDGIIVNIDEPFVQQSHHCGIETTRRLMTPSLSLKAAIAPLWD